MIDRYQPVWIQSCSKLRLVWIPYDPPQFLGTASANEGQK
jgi:hypothetical protein